MSQNELAGSLVLAISMFMIVGITGIMFMARGKAVRDD
jgi:hypothetical protein